MRHGSFLGSRRSRKGEVKVGVQKRLRPLIGVVLTLAAITGACGSDDGEEAAPATTTAEPATPTPSVQVGDIATAAASLPPIGSAER